MDNVLGWGPNQGVFFNVAAISGNSNGGGFGSPPTTLTPNIAPLLVLGTNTLYINATDLGGPAGLLFSATITTTEVTSAVPEPASSALVGLGIAGLIGSRWRRLFMAT